jgi:hypothetical protein
MKSEPHRKLKSNCVYVLVDTRKPRQRVSRWVFEGEPFYVGRSSNLSNRIEQHLYNHESKNSFKQAVLRKIKREKLQPIVRVLKEGLSIEQANAFEAEVIRLIGRRCENNGPLTNLTDGGDGALGSKRTVRFKRRASNRAHLQWLPSHLAAIKSWSGVFDYAKGYKGRHKYATYRCSIHGELQQMSSEVSKAIRAGRTCPACGKLLRPINISRAKMFEPLIRTTPVTHLSIMKQYTEA